MGSLSDIIRRNNSTFYDNRSGNRTPVWPRYALFTALSGCFALLVGTPSDAVVSSVITVQSILVGFGFSVLFFLVSTEHEDEEASGTLEDKTRRRRLNKLSDELFYNISYYNIVTILSVLFALAFAFDISPLSRNLAAATTYLGIGPETKQSISTTLGYIHYIVVWGFYLAFIESIFTFCRIVVRVNFYFSQKRKVSIQKRTE